MNRQSFAGRTALVTFGALLAAAAPIPSPPAGVRGSSLEPWQEGGAPAGSKTVASLAETIEAMPKNLARAKGPDLAAATAAAQAAVGACAARGVPVSALIADAAGEPVVLLSGDGAGVRSQLIARTKANIVVRYGRPSGDIAELARTDAKLTAEAAADPAIGVLRGGGFPVMRGGERVGVIAVSGGSLKGDLTLDETCARAGLDRLQSGGGTTTAPTPLGWITLGTKGGPVPNPERSQPANALLVGGRAWLVDCGDGTAERLAAAGLKPTDVHAVFLSHLHMDHIGGLQGLIGIRWMMRVETPLIIYGPPGTQELVDGLVRALTPSVAIARDEPMKGLDPARMVKVVILRGGDAAMLAGVRVRTIRNSHFDAPPGHPLENGSQSLSYRFDREGYAITYTGDTGWSDALVALARGSDLLVSEMIDLDGADAAYSKKTDMPAPAKAAMLSHLRSQHLSPQETGKLAAAAGVKRLVLTHLSIFGPAAEVFPKVAAQAHETFAGPVTVARDLDRF